MGSILKYNESFLQAKGGFVDSNGNYLNTEHSTFVRNFFSDCKCNSKQYKLLKDFISSFNGKKPCCEEVMIILLTQFFRYDVISNVYLYKNIITTDAIPSEKYYNYALMDFDIQSKPTIVRQGKRRFVFSYDEINDYDNRYQERLLQEEIEEIKKDVPLLSRKLYFK